MHVAGRSVRPAEGGAARRGRRVRRRRARPHRCDGGADVVHAQLLAERRRRPPRQARARPAVRVHVPHAGAGQGRRRRPRAGVARPRRGRDHRLRRRDLRQLHRGGAPVPPALRRPARPDRDRRRRASSTPSSRPATARGARRAIGLPSTCPCCCSSGGSSRSRGPTSRSAPSPRSARRRAAADRRRGQRRRRRRRGGPRSRARRRARRAPTRSASSTPQPHHILSTYYRAADVVIVPSRSESFGLVALEAAACGIPVVASAVGGLLSPRRRRRHRLPRRTAAIPAGSPGTSTEHPRRPGAGGVDAVARRRARAALHVELRRGPPAPRLHRPHRARSSSSALLP